jgi:diguanylate cyclase
MTTATLINPPEIAKETIRQLALRKMAPTPDNYSRLYGEIGGVMQTVPRVVPDGPGAEQWSEALHDFLRGWDASIHGVTQARKRETLERLLARRSPNAAELHKRFQRLVKSWGEGQPREDGSEPACAATLPVVAQAVEPPVPANDLQEVVTGLTLLLQLLLSNIGELTSDDRWLKGQMEKLRELVGAPMSVRSIVDAHRSMREVISKQGTINHSLEEARQALKAMLASFVDRLGTMSAHTGDFHGKIEGYAERIAESDDFSHLSEIVRELLSETRGMQTDIGRTRDELQAAQRRAVEYETKVRDLESQLEHVSGLVCEDPLTSALNRRGLDEAFEKESARCQRSGQPMSVAVLDVDNFKILNDRLGHQAGDYALMHLVDVVREAIRPTDVLGRYGGEEFVILLPDTALEAAEAATVRVQRALTRRFFLHNNERQLITFSAGVAQFTKGESWDTILERADRALYEAKRLGKNRVVLAAPAVPPIVTPAAGSRGRSA